MNIVVQILENFYAAHWFLFWLVAILGFPEIEIAALIAIAIAAL